MGNIQRFQESNINKTYNRRQDQNSYDPRSVNEKSRNRERSPQRQRYHHGQDRGQQYQQRDHYNSRFDRQNYNQRGYERKPYHNHHYNDKRYQKSAYDSTADKVLQKERNEQNLKYGVQNEQEEMMKLMGMTSFSTTKGKKVKTNKNQMVAASYKPEPRKYRQYMNRKGGFNRPL